VLPALKQREYRPSAQRIASTSVPSARPFQARSAVKAGRPRRQASARQARSPTQELRILEERLAEHLDIDLEPLIAARVEARLEALTRHDEEGDG